MRFDELSALLEREGRLSSVHTFRLRIFVSVDVVGSTAHKQRIVPSLGDNHATPWLKTFTEFYAKMANWVGEEWRALPARLGDVAPVDASSLAPSRQPTMWKAIGDEVVYCYVLDDLRMAPVVLELFRTVLTKLKHDLRQDGLSAKATAWLAGFPVTNSEIVFGQRDDDLLGAAKGQDWFFGHFLRIHLHEIRPGPHERLDFLGPQMDLGFRLTSWSTPRRMVLSIGIAWILAHYAPVWTDWQAELDAESGRAPRSLGELDKNLYFDGAHGLKGVLGGAPYPRFWFDCGDGALSIQHDRLEGRSAADRNTVLAYHAAFIEEYRERFPWLTQPFVAGMGDEQRAGLGKYHQGRIRDLDELWRTQVEKCFADEPERGVPMPDTLTKVVQFIDEESTKLKTQPDEVTTSTDVRTGGGQSEHAPVDTDDNSIG